MQVSGLAAWVLVSFGAAAIGGVAAVHARSYYRTLSHPHWAPPGWVFGPVWSVLYAMMGIAAWMVWREGGFRERKGALLLFLVQLAANSLWTWLFFAWRRPGLALAEIAILWLLIAATMLVFWRARRAAGALLLPYWLWVSFATVLNAALWRLNPGLPAG